MPNQRAHLAANQCSSAHGGNDTVVAQSDFGALAIGDAVTMDGHAVGGNDLLVSGQISDDIMWGDAATIGSNAIRGDNLFVFAPQNGHDQIMDYQPGKDRIELAGFGFGSLQDVANLFHTTSEGVLISFDASDGVLVRGVSAGQLTANDFLLA